VSGRQMSGGERGRNDSGEGTGVWKCEWRTGVNGSVGGMGGGLAVYSEGGVGGKGGGSELLWR
jgi:hypothetical protein